MLGERRGKMDSFLGTVCAIAFGLFIGQLAIDWWRK